MNILPPAFPCQLPSHHEGRGKHKQTPALLFDNPANLSIFNLLPPLKYARNVKDKECITQAKLRNRECVPASVFLVAFLGADHRL